MYTTVDRFWPPAQNSKRPCIFITASSSALRFSGRWHINLNPKNSMNVHNSEPSGWFAFSSALRCWVLHRLTLISTACTALTSLPSDSPDISAAFP